MVRALSEAPRPPMPPPARSFSLGPSSAKISCGGSSIGLYEMDYNYCDTDKNEHRDDVAAIESMEKALKCVRLVIGSDSDENTLEKNMRNRKIEYDKIAVLPITARPPPPPPPPRTSLSRSSSFRERSNFFRPFSGAARNSNVFVASTVPKPASSSWVPLSSSSSSSSPARASSAPPVAAANHGFFFRWR
jgi:hypothetical protein